MSIVEDPRRNSKALVSTQCWTWWYSIYLALPGNDSWHSKLRVRVFSLTGSKQFLGLLVILGDALGSSALAIMVHGGAIFCLSVLEVMFEGSQKWA